MRRYFIGKSFQSKVVRKAFILTMASEILFCSAAYFVLKKDIRGGFPATLETVRSFKFSLPFAIGLSEAAALPVLAIGIAVIGILMSHKLAGPLWKVENTARMVADGNLSGNLTLRENDEVQEFARQVNGMVKGLREKVCGVEEAYLRLNSSARRLRDKSPFGMSATECAETVSEVNRAAGELVERLDAIKTSN
ncbi:MAG: HAMP domain-containing protein [Nitrospirota bacterium]